MELITPSPLLVAILTLACVVPLFLLLIQTIRTPGIERLRRFTAVVVVLGAALPILNILFILSGLNIFLLDITDLSPIPANLLHGYIQHVPFVFFLISAILLLHPKAPRYALQVELTWGVIWLFNLAVFALVVYQIVT